MARTKQSARMQTGGGTARLTAAQRAARLEQSRQELKERMVRARRLLTVLKGHLASAELQGTLNATSSCMLVIEQQLAEMRDMLVPASDSDSSDSD